MTAINIKKEMLIEIEVPTDEQDVKRIEKIKEANNSIHNLKVKIVTLLTSKGYNTSKIRYKNQKGYMQKYNKRRKYVDILQSFLRLNAIDQLDWESAIEPQFLLGGFFINEKGNVTYPELDKYYEDQIKIIEKLLKL